MQPLPVILKPVPDELLSSWLSRHAAFYGLAPLGLLRKLLPDASFQNIRAVDLRLTETAAERLSNCLRCSPAEIRRMTHSDLANEAKWLVSQTPIQLCHSCSSQSRGPHAQCVCLRHSYRGWRITCPLCGSKLSPPPECDELRHEGANLSLPTDAWREACEGERLLDRFLTADEETAVAAIAACRMLLVPRACLPNTTERRRFMPRAIYALVPWFDDLAKQCTLNSDRWSGRSIAPLPLRSGLLIGFRRLLEKPRPRFHILRSVTLGNYRLRLEILGAKATPILGPLWYS